VVSAPSSALLRISVGEQPRKAERRKRERCGVDLGAELANGVPPIVSVLSLKLTYEYVINFWQELQIEKVGQMPSPRLLSSSPVPPNSSPTANRSCMHDASYFTLAPFQDHHTNM